jgi:transketolase
MTATLKTLHAKVNDPRKPRREIRRSSGERGDSRLVPGKPAALAGPDTALEDRRRVARLRLLRLHFEARVGHIGGNLSALDILLCLYHDVLGPNDQFILSKGHAAGALYVTLWTVGRLTDEELQQFHQDGTRLSGHPPATGVPEVLFATGSLGHGPSLAAGLALAKKIKGEPGRVYCLTSDGEWNEGACWEAVIFARHHQLDNLTFIVDLNGLQGFGTTREVADLGSLADRFRAFQLSTAEVAGHDSGALAAALGISASVPRMVVARTLKGCGVSFMEGRMEWHYLALSAEQYQQARTELEHACVLS